MSQKYTVVASRSTAWWVEWNSILETQKEDIRNTLREVITKRLETNTGEDIRIDWGTLLETHPNKWALPPFWPKARKVIVCNDIPLWEVMRTMDIKTPYFIKAEEYDERICPHPKCLVRFYKHLTRASS